MVLQGMAKSGKSKRRKHYWRRCYGGRSQCSSRFRILGKVLTIEPNNKGLVCSVTLKTKTSIIKRPVSLRKKKLSSTLR